MRKRKGFTLIELLAVIVVLAVIALIGTPIVLNLINTAKKGAAEQSAIIYLKEIENYMILNQMNPEKYPLKLEAGKSYQLTEEVYSDIAINTNNLIPVVYAEEKEKNFENNMYVGNYIYINGTYPESGIITIGENNTVKSASMDISGYAVDCDNMQCNAIGKSKSDIIRVKEVKITDKSVTELIEGDTLTLTAKVLPDNATSKDIAWLSSDHNVATVENGIITAHREGTVTIVAKSGSKTDSISLKVKAKKGPTISMADKDQTYKAIIYLNPKNIDEYCDSKNFDSTTGKKDGCMRWYVYSDDDDSYTMILDHNTTALVAWNSTGNNKVMKEIKEALDNDTNGWIGTAKIISADEVAAITGNKKFNESNSTSGKWFYLDDNSQNQTSTSKGESKYAWLFDYTNGCTSYGCNVDDSSNNGYWTSSTVYDHSSNAWRVRNYGNLRSQTVKDNASYGLRPVLTISKKYYFNNEAQ